MATSNVNQQGSNSGPIMQALKDACYDFGTREGDGLTARVNFCDMITARAHSGDITVEGAAEAWADYQKGVVDKTKGTTEEKKFDSSEIEQRAADLKHYITLGANTHMDGPAVLANARMLLTIMRVNGTAKGTRTWDVMLVFLRKQNKFNERELSDNEIEDLFRAEAAKGQDELGRMTSVLNMLNKQISIYENEQVARDEQRERDETSGDRDPDDQDQDQDDLPDGIQGIYTARDLVESRIAELGGTRKEQRKAERTRLRELKAQAKAAAKHASP